MRLLLLLAASWLAGLAAFSLSAPRATLLPPATTADSTRPRRDERLARQRSRIARLLWVAGIPLPALAVYPLQVLAAFAAGSFALGATKNPVVAAFLAVWAFHAPPAVIEQLALARWRAIDREAYTLANTLRLVLPVHSHPVSAIRDLAGGTQEPLRSLLTAALAREAEGVPLESALRDLADRLRHVELGLLAEILRADRHERPAAALLAELLDAWTERIRADQRRHARLATARRFTSAVVGLPVAGFLLLPILDPASSAIFQGSLAGQVLAALGMSLFAAAHTVAGQTLRRSQEVTF